MTIIASTEINMNIYIYIYIYIYILKINYHGNDYNDVKSNAKKRKIYYYNITDKDKKH